MRSAVRSAVVALFAVGGLLGQQQAEERHPHCPLGEILPPPAQQRAMTRYHLRPALQKAIAHHDVLLRSTSAPLPDALRDRLQADIGVAPIVHVHEGRLLDGRDVYFATGAPHPEFCRREAALAILDPETGAVAGIPLPKVPMSDAWANVPRLQQVDLDRDGAFELVLPVHHHNGTVEDFDARHYLRVAGERLVADLVLVDACKHVYPPHPEGLIRQVLVADEADRLRIVTWYEHAGEADILVPLGYGVVARDGAGTAYRERLRKAWVPGAEWALGPRASDLRPR